ncbi:hypothetical protein CHELA41_20781 [Hyphomicrobiales bacterium]|nr:hypothetical protein CHELA41_20781 [Hyphomicrobiales bacterium]
MRPVGAGIGATHAACKVSSPTRAAGNPPMNTVDEAADIIPGPPGKQPAMTQGAVTSPRRAAGRPPIRTLGSPLTNASGMAGCAQGAGTGAAG